MPFTPQQFLDAIATHELSPRKVAPRGWICLTRTGTILQRERDAKPTPEEAKQHENSGGSHERYHLDLCQVLERVMTRRELIASLCASESTTRIALVVATPVMALSRHGIFQDDCQGGYNGYGIPYGAPCGSVGPVVAPLFSDGFETGDTSRWSRVNCRDGHDRNGHGGRGCH